jgi:hypothetical protein
MRHRAWSPIRFLRSFSAAIEESPRAAVEWVVARMELHRRQAVRVLRVRERRPAPLHT